MLMNKTENLKLVEIISKLEVIESYKKIGLDVKSYLHEDIKLYLCKESGLRFYYPIENMGDKKFYSYLSEVRPGYYSKMRWEHERALHYLRFRPGSSVYEFGCGPGFFLDNLGASFQRYATDFNPSVENDINKLGVSFIAPENLRSENISFDSIVSFQVLEHVTNPSEILNIFNKKLKENGELYIGVPNSNPYLYKYDKLHALNLPPHHFTLWNKQSLIKFVEGHGFKLLKLEIEPLFDKDFFMEKLLEHFFGKKIGAFLHRNVYRRHFNRFNLLLNRYEGRNLFAIFQKV